MPKLFSYVVDHDDGFSPYPFRGFCTLARCKFGSPHRRNIVELAKFGDWIVGTGGAGPRSAGHGKLIYAMRVSEKLTLRNYLTDPRFKGRPDNYGADAHNTKRFALISRDFFYFGTRAPDLKNVPRPHVNHPLEKRGPGFRSDFTEPFIADFAAWLRSKFRRGVHGLPCGGRPSQAPQVVCHRAPPRAFACPVRNC